MSVKRSTIGGLFNFLLENRCVIILRDANNGDVPLWYDLQGELNESFNLNHWSPEELSIPIEFQESRLLENTPSIFVETAPSDWATLKRIIVAAMPVLNLPAAPTLAMAINLVALNGGLPYFEQWKECCLSILSSGASGFVNSLCQFLDTDQVGLTDIGVYDLTGNRSLSGSKQLYLPLRVQHGWPTWIIFTILPVGFSYHFGFRLSPTTELIEIRPEALDYNQVDDVFKFLANLPLGTL